MSPHAVARRNALAYGPSSLECTEANGYGSSVLARSRSNPPGDWDQRVRLYSDGLLRGGWAPSFPESQRAVKFPSEDNHWHFHCPVNLVFGLQDVALDARVVLDGIENHFVAESDDPVVSKAMAEARIIKLEDCGHWSVLEEEGRQALDRVLARIIV